MKKQSSVSLIVMVGLLFVKALLSAQDANEAARLGNLLYPEMVLVEGGTFTMGDEWGEGDEDELPTHEITLRNYKISKTEVTVKQYRQFCRETNRSMPETPSWGWQDVISKFAMYNFS